MDIEKKLKEKIKKDAKFSIIVGIVICIILLGVIIGFIIGRAKEVENGNTETSTWLNFGTVCMIIALSIVFVRQILFPYLDLKQDIAENYETIKIVAIRVRTTFDVIRGTWDSYSLVENIETGEQFNLKDCGDMKENETYIMLRSKRSKQFVYEPLENENASNPQN